MTKLERLTINILHYSSTGSIDSDFVNLHENISYASLCIAHQVNKKFDEVNDWNLNEVLKFEEDLALEYANEYLQDIAD